MRVGPTMKKHLNLPEDVVAIHQSSGHPWNGWLEYEQGFYDFWAGLFDKVIQHLLKCEACREEAGLTLEEVKELAERIDREWEVMTR